MTTEKRNFSGLSFSSKKHSNDSNSHLPTKLKNFFRINSLGSSSVNSDGPPTPKSESRSDSKSTFRQSRFLPSIGRNRSATVASEGNPLEEHMSPTAHANPYFAHQGPPALRHHNEGSVPPSPPDTPKLQVNGVNGVDEKPITTGKEELARKLRRVASAPNAQGLFSSNKTDNRPRTAELGKDPVVVEVGVSPKVSIVVQEESHLLPVPQDGAKIPLPGQIRQAVAFRRTYSSNSIKVRNVEVGPGSFDKIKLIGKGDVGKVYLVREKKSNRLYAMKGEQSIRLGCAQQVLTTPSPEQEGDDQAQQNQTSVGRTRNPGNQQSPLYRNVIPLLSVRRPFISVYGVLQWRRILSSSADSTREMCCGRRCKVLCCRGYRGIGVSSSHGIYIPRSEARKYGSPDNVGSMTVLTI
jgi:hypothetical protein